MKKPPDSAVILVAGVLVVGVALPEHKPYWFESPHTHVEFPEGTTGHFSGQISWDSGAATNTAARSLYYDSMTGKK
jgi:hypothetical protein